MAETFGDLLRRHLDTFGESRPSVASRAGIDSSYISRLLNGGRNPSRDMVHLLADAMEVSEPQRDELLKAAGFTHHGTDIPPYLQATVDLIEDTRFDRTVRDLFKGMAAGLSSLADMVLIAEDEK